MMVLISTAVTAVATPIISILYDPEKPYMVSKRRTVQHSQPCSELKIVACIHDQDSVSFVINLLEFSHPSLKNPLSVYAIHLIELIGQTTPVFIDHSKAVLPSKYQAYDHTQNAFRRYRETNGAIIEFHSFSAVVPKRTMYQNICELALVKEAVLIILPLHDEWLDSSSASEINYRRAPSVISNVLDHAPCSVGVLVHLGHCRNPLISRPYQYSTCHFILLFLGGADAREALAFTERTVANPEASVTVIRFLPRDCEPEDKVEKKLDDGAVTWFWSKHGGNEQVMYREVAVNNGEETLAIIRALKSRSYDLWITGRKEGIHPVLLQGLSNWNEHPELGVIGDYIASMEFEAPTSVLVVQQQILRGQHNA